MIKHLQKKTIIKMAASQKYKSKTEWYHKPWDLITSITAYFTGLDKIQTSLPNRGIATSIDKMMIAADARMCDVSHLQMNCTIVLFGVPN